jgi:hypothetical protein
MAKDMDITFIPVSVNVSQVRVILTCKQILTGEGLDGDTQGGGLAAGSRWCGENGQLGVRERTEIGSEGGDLRSKCRLWWGTSLCDNDRTILAMAR